MKKVFLILIIFLIIYSILFCDDIKLNIIFTNDIHGGIDAVPATFLNPDFPPPFGGGAASATYINRIRKNAKENGEEFLLIDAGDFFQGHPIGTMTNGTAIIKYMNMVHYDAMTIGNHEFDAGYEELKKTLSLAKFPIVCANIVLKETGAIIPEAVPYIIKEFDGIKIGIIGICTEETPMMSFPEHIKGLKFLSVSKTVEKYKKIVKQKGADIIIVLGHLGIPYDVESAYQHDIVEGHINDPNRRWPDNAMHLAHKVPGIDIIFAGHIHKGYKKPWEEPDNHTLIFQNYAYGSNLGHIIITVDEVSETISGYELPAYLDGDLISMASEEILPDPIVKKTIDSLQAIAEKGMDEYIGEATIHLTKEGASQSLIGNTVMDAMREETNADFAFLNLGGVRDNITKGPVTYRDVFKVLPFESRIVTMDISGAKLKEILEFRVSGSRHGIRISGGKVVNNRNYPNFERITNLEINGKTWSPDSIYTVATTDFLMQGNAGLTLLTKIPENQITYYNIVIRDALANYFRTHKKVAAKIDDRWIRDDNSVHSPVIKKFNNFNKK
ncbi:MAG: bifunctional UDP-sugar hydrolase/5'-nucleotidase [Candidatus Cloacimonadota bacterium]|nr:bifunctional UDP-sugar hydrolase/5'-nucleotidase [Candidatus Cloacimonadota bacterium]